MLIHYNFSDNFIPYSCTNGCEIWSTFRNSEEITVALSTPKPCVFCITFDLSKPYLRDCSFEISVSVLLAII